MSPPYDISESVHLWLLRIEDLPQLRARLGAEELLSADERQRMLRFVRESSRQQFLAARLLIRGALSVYADRPPGAWRFGREPDGRPTVLDSPGGLDFNLAHTHELVACVISRDRRAGVDVERTPARDELLGVRNKLLTGPELTRLAALPRDEELAQLARYWALKEAYTKALGVGLRRGFTTFGVDLTGAHARLDDPLSDRHWHLSHVRIDDHVVAVAADSRPRTAPVPVWLVDAVPALLSASSEALAHPVSRLDVSGLAPEGLSLSGARLSAAA